MVKGTRHEGVVDAGWDAYRSRFLGGDVPGAAVSIPPPNIEHPDRAGAEFDDEVVSQNITGELNSFTTGSGGSSFVPVPTTEEEKEKEGEEKEAQSADTGGTGTGTATNAGTVSNTNAGTVSSTGGSGGGSGSSSVAAVPTEDDAGELSARSWYSGQIQATPTPAGAAVLAPSSSSLAGVDTPPAPRETAAEVLGGAGDVLLVAAATQASYDFFSDHPACRLPPIDQAGCGACWAAAASRALSHAACRAAVQAGVSGEAARAVVSTGHLLACSRERGKCLNDDCCSGNSLLAAFDAMNEFPPAICAGGAPHVAVPGPTVPAGARDATCSGAAELSAPCARLGFLARLAPEDKIVPKSSSVQGEEGLKAAIQFGGPVIVRFFPTVAFAGFIGPGLFQACLDPTTMGETAGASSAVLGIHYVLVTGWGTDPVLGPYWNLINSWGAFYLDPSETDGGDGSLLPSTDIVRVPRGVNCMGIESATGYSVTAHVQSSGKELSEVLRAAPAGPDTSTTPQQPWPGSENGPCATFECPSDFVLRDPLHVLYLRNVAGSRHLRWQSPPAHV
jgi:hypothetical protein